MAHKDQLSSKLKQDLSPLLNGELLLDAVTRAAYNSAAGIYRIPPAGVVVPRDDRDVLSTVRYACEQASCAEDEERLSVIARGAGTGVAGQAIGTGLVIDTSRHMSNILEINPKAGYVRLQPGVVCDTLNMELARTGHFFPPDPSSSAYCTVGGMISTNASGAHTIKYGATIDYVQELDAVIGTGDQLTFKEMPLHQIDGPASFDDPPTIALTRSIAKILTNSVQDIDAYSPKTEKNSSGYLLNHVIQNGSINLSRLITGSEGTLGIITKAKLRVIPKPQAIAMGVIYFDSVESTAASIMAIRGLAPSSLDLIDGHALDVILSGRPDLAVDINTSAHAVLLVEFDADTTNEVREMIEVLRQTVSPPNGNALGIVEAFDPVDQQKFWTIRKSFLPLLYRADGPRRAIAFVEDVTVPPEKIAEYVRSFYDIMSSHGVEAAISGHAGDANFHARPFLDLSNPVDCEKLHAISEDVFELVSSLGGTLSGEHGDGLVRTPFLRRQFGPLYDLFVEIKRLFDPKNILNPGKIVDSNASHLAANLKAEIALPDQWKRGEVELQSGEMKHGFERCQACGKCRIEVSEDTRMCPVFQALHNEIVSPRAKVNLIRELVSGQLTLDEQTSRNLKVILDLCLMCGSCALECPAEVNVPTLIRQIRGQLNRSLGISMEERVMGLSEEMSRVASATAPLTNAALKNRAARWFVEKVTGLHRRRPPLPFSLRNARQRLRQYSDRHDEKVVYFLDLYAHYNDPGLAEIVAQVLDKCGLSVVLPPQSESGMPAIASGNAARVRRLIRKNIASLLPYVRDGYHIITTEPTAALSLCKEYQSFDSSSEVAEVAERVYDISEYLLALHKTGNLDTDFRSIPLRLAYHVPCHLRHLEIGTPALDLLSLVPDLDVVTVEEGCCGLGGTFGMKSENYELSMRIGRNLFNVLGDPHIMACITDCSACRMQIEHGTGKPVLHPIELLHAAYDLSMGERKWDKLMENGY